MRCASAFVYVRLLFPRDAFNLAAISASVGPPAAGFTFPLTGPSPTNTEGPKSRLVLEAGPVPLNWLALLPSGTAAVPSAAPL